MAVALGAALLAVASGCSGAERRPAPGAAGDGSSGAAGAADGRLGAAAGAVRVVKFTGPGFDRFTRTARYARWIRRRFWRMLTYSPYFDSRLRWYRDAWVYRDLYAIYRGGALARRHPDWILRDARGRRLYIPYDCGGSCPQYAADVGNPSFRADWIRRARATLRRGYRGIFIDDVNMLLRVSDGRGREVPPVDPRTGSPMSLAAWRQYVASFVAEIRAAFPRVELVHNVIWLAGDDDPDIQHQLAAADFVSVEHGVNDPGLRGSGDYALASLLAYIDRRHEDGAGVVLGDGGPRAAEQEYALAGYLLVNSGSDALAARFGSRPGDWWRGYGTSLGAPRGPRHRWRGLLRRDFERGLVLANPPDAPRRARTLGRPYVDLEGRRRRSVVLPAASGAVLRSVPAPPRP